MSALIIPNCYSPEVGAIFDRCEGAFAPLTLNGYRTDINNYSRWCAQAGHRAYPAEPSTVAAFVEVESARVRPSTLRRRLAAIRFIHVYGDQPDPTKASVVRLAMRRASMRTQRRPAQAEGLTHDRLRAILAACPDSLEGLRDGALIGVGYDTLCRSSELVRLKVEDLGIAADAGSILIRRAKSDQAGDGRVAWLSPDTLERVRAWMWAAGVEERYLFRAVHRGYASDEPLVNSSVRRLVKRAAERAGLDEAGQRLSGHSMRVGGAQDMLLAGFDALAIMQAGGWKTPHIVLRYVEQAHTEQLHKERWARLNNMTGQHHGAHRLRP